MSDENFSRKVARFTLLLLLTPGFSGAQPANNTALLGELYRYPKTVASIKWLDNSENIRLEDSLWHSGLQILLKSDHGLFLFFNGTGRVYKAVTTGDGISFQRLDSTVYAGYNVGSYPFTYNDSIYSLGGYGFWRVNGQLRVFDEKVHQWDIVKLNVEIPILCDGERDLIWYDLYGKKIYVGASFERNEAVISNSPYEARQKYQLSVLDLTKKEWQVKGDLTNFFITNAALIRNIASTPWGQMVLLGNKACLVDYLHNRLFTLAPQKDHIINRVFSNLPGQTPYTFYFSDSILYWGNTNSNWLDSMSIKTSDILPSNEKVYIPRVHPFGNLGLLFLLIALLLITSFILIRLRSMARSRGSSIRQDINIESGRTLKDITLVEHATYDYDEREISLVKVLAHNSLNNGVTEANELNKILGLGNKSSEVQKKQRSDIILSINRKFSRFYGTSGQLIEKRRSTQDARSFEYFVDYNKFKIFESHLKFRQL